MLKSLLENIPNAFEAGIQTPASLVYDCNEQLLKKRVNGLAVH
jgi:hypothetical protein